MKKIRFFLLFILLFGMIGQSALAASAPISSTLVIDEKSTLVSGEKVYVEVTTEDHGEIILTQLNYQEKKEETKAKTLSRIKTIRRGSKYMTTGVFTPKNPADYHISFLMWMKDKDGKITSSVAAKTITVSPKEKIEVSISPLTSTISVNDVLLIDFKYKGPSKSYSFDYSHEDVLKSVNLQEYPREWEPDGYTHNYYIFRPNKKGKITLKITVNALRDDGSISLSNTASTTITVK
ncbi:hypothetical protein [Brevibacillus choshinensis]|uniref:Cohesin domain-containing protein n=1 Tax=Brevibacillus choshinensis TaxID=54911 RepID=A0ABX7FM63_BRECH|nr:hypothetical protein [Brevibacillus choshinensis]QRG66734.1 hypothetical protein JNE38_25035 [Brevibacillus choshinensis]